MVVDIFQCFLQFLDCILIVVQEDCMDRYNCAQAKRNLSVGAGSFPTAE